MGQTAKAPRENRTIIVDFHDESTYFQLTLLLDSGVLGFRVAQESSLIFKAIER